MMTCHAWQLTVFAHSIFPSFSCPSSLPGESTILQYLLAMLAGPQVALYLYFTCDMLKGNQLVVFSFVTMLLFLGNPQGKIKISANLHISTAAATKIFWGTLPPL